MEEKRGIEKPRIMMLDNIKADRESWRNWMPRTCFQTEHQ